MKHVSFIVNKIAFKLVTDQTFGSESYNYKYDKYENMHSLLIKQPVIFPIINPPKRY